MLVRLLTNHKWTCFPNVPWQSTSFIRVVTFGAHHSRSNVVPFISFYQFSRIFFFRSLRPLYLECIVYCSSCYTYVNWCKFSMNYTVDQVTGLRVNLVLFEFERVWRMVGRAVVASVIVVDPSETWETWCCCLGSDANWIWLSWICNTWMKSKFWTDFVPPDSR